MAIELSAVRLIAPWFGTSQAVWTSAIGAVLVALTCGYLVGARWARSPRPERVLSACLWFSGAWAVALPTFAPWLASSLVPDNASLEQIAQALPLTSLACSLCLFFPPAALLATAGPLVVEVVSRRTSASAGEAGGQVLACSTLGSIVGTFGTTYISIPVLGVKGALLLAAALICLGALLASRAGRQHVAAVLALGLSLTGAKASAGSPDVIALAESPYQQVRVVQRADGWRSLEVNEQRGSFQSVWAPAEGLLGPGYYYDLFALAPAWAAPREGWRTLILGQGAGTAVRVLEGTLSEDVQLETCGVELDPMVIELAQEHMGLAVDRPDRRSLGGWDARLALKALTAVGERWDHVIVDAYANQVEIPAHLVTDNFFYAVSEALDRDGWLQVNVGGGGIEDPLVLAIGATMADVFGRPTLALEVPFSRNVILTQRPEGTIPDPTQDHFCSLSGELSALARRVSLPGTWAWIDHEDGGVLRDQKAPLESLQRQSLKLMGAEG